MIGRPKGVKNRKYTYEFKFQVITDYFDNHLSKQDIFKKYDISHGTFETWKNNYLKGCLETGNVRRRGNKYAALHTSKSLTNEQRLELENLKLKIEVERLKKGYLVKGGGANKEYVSISDVNTKSSKH